MLLYILLGLDSLVGLFKNFNEKILALTMKITIFSDSGGTGWITEEFQFFANYGL